MATMVGTQKDFDDAIIALLELEYDAVGAYQLAIEKLETVSYKAKLTEFLDDHKKHIRLIKEAYATSDLKLPDSADRIKGSLAKLKVALGNAIGSVMDTDLSILKSMLSNEKDTNTAYERMNQYTGQSQEIMDILEDAYQDEIKHYNWISSVVKN